MKEINLILLISLFMLSSCQPKGEVKVETSGIFEKITFGMTTELSPGKMLNLSNNIIDLDEWDSTKGNLPITITVTNHSAYPYYNLNIKMKTIDDDGDDLNTDIRLAYKSGQIFEFPGYNGTCQRILAPKNSCTIKLELVFDREGIFQEGLALEFTNLVNPEVYQGEIKVLAGSPAKLEVKAGGSAQIFFSDDGQSSLPLVERTGRKSFQKEIIIKNVGKLRARKFDYNEVSETCRNLAPDECGMQFREVYNFTTDEKCSALKGKDFPSGAECRVTVNYRPKNIEDANLYDDEQITYRGGAQFTYFSNPTDTLGSLGLSFESISSKIEGRLFGSNFIPSFGNVIQGRKASADFIVFNRGYRDLRIKKLKFLTPDGLPWGTCTGSSDLPSPPLLTCRTDNNDEEFPYRLEDTDRCLFQNPKEKMVPVDGSCTFKIHFRPSSIKFFDPILTPPPIFKDSDYSISSPKIEVEYDSFWKGGEDQCLPSECVADIRNKSLKFKSAALNGKRQKAARLTITKITDPHNQGSITATLGTEGPDYLSTFDRNYSFNLGNIPVLGAAFNNIKYFKDVEITFKNTGDAPAKLINIFDKDFSNLFFDSSTAAGSNFIQQIKTNKNCTILAKDEECVLSFKFAPYSILGGAEAWLFDDGDSTKGRKFTIEYENGMNFINELGDNSDGLPHDAKAKATFTLFANLIIAGSLAETTTMSTNATKFDNTVKGSDITYTFTHQNIGSGNVGIITSKIGTNHTPEVNTVLLPQTVTAESCLLGGANRDDCRCRTACAGNYPLQPAQTCTISYKTKLSPTSPTSIGNGLNTFVLDYQMTNIHTPEVSSTAFEIEANFNDCATIPGIPAATRSLRPHRVALNAMKDPALVLPAINPAGLNHWQSSYLVKVTPARKFFRSTSDIKQSYSGKPEQIPNQNFINPVKDFSETNPTAPSSATYDYHFFMGYFYSPTAPVSNTLLLKNVGNSLASNFSVTTEDGTSPELTRATVLATTILAKTNLILTFSLNHVNCASGSVCEYKQLITVKYDTSKTDLVDSNPTTCIDRGFDLCTREIKILVTGKIDKVFTPSSFAIAQKTIEVSAIAGKTTFDETGCSDSGFGSSFSPSFNQTDSTSTFTIFGVAVTNTLGRYAKVLLKLTNNSGQKITWAPNGSYFGLRSSLSQLGVSQTNMASMGLFTEDSCISKTGGTSLAEGQFCSKVSELATNASCFIGLKFQPLNGSVSPPSKIYLSLGLQQSTSPGVLLNIPFALDVKVPAFIAPTNCVATNFLSCQKDIFYTNGQRARSFEVTFPDITQNGATTTTRDLLIDLKANGTTTASLKVQSPVSYDADLFTVNPIFNGPDPDKLMKVYAHKNCIDGFSGSSSNCQLKAKIEFSAKNIYRNYFSDKTANAMELQNNWIYLIKDLEYCTYWDSIYRVCNADFSKINIELKFNVKPFALTALSQVTLAESTKHSIKFSPPSLSVPSHIGYRIFQFKNPQTAATQNLFTIKPDNANVKYFDYFTTNGSILTLSNPGIADNEFYGYRIMAIMENPVFNYGDIFGLTNTNAYLNEIANSPTLKVLTPGENFTYFHDEKILVDHAFMEGMDYLKADGYCRAEKLTYRDSTLITKSKEIIDEITFHKLSPSFKNDLHWIKSNLVPFEQVCPAFPPGAVYHLSCVKLNAPDTEARLVLGPIDNINPNPTETYNGGYISGEIDSQILTRCMTRLP